MSKFINCLFLFVIFVSLDGRSALPYTKNTADIQDYQWKLQGVQRRLRNVYEDVDEIETTTPYVVQRSTQPARIELNQADDVQLSWGESNDYIHLGPYNGFDGGPPPPASRSDRFDRNYFGPPPNGFGYPHGDFRFHKQWPGSWNSYEHGHGHGYGYGQGHEHGYGHERRGEHGHGYVYGPTNYHQHGYQHFGYGQDDCDFDHFGNNQGNKGHFPFKPTIASTKKPSTYTVPEELEHTSRPISGNVGSSAKPKVEQSTYPNIDIRFDPKDVKSE